MNSYVNPSLTKFMTMVKSGKIRSNVSQAAGHLILIGAEEYKELIENQPNFWGWKVGAYEPTDNIHSDIEYLYEIDLDTKIIQCWTMDGAKKISKVRLTK